MVKVFCAEINIGNQVASAYTSKKVDDSGLFVFYLDSTQLATLIGMTELSTHEENLPPELKALEKQSRWILEEKYKNSYKEFSKFSLWDTKFCTNYLSYYARSGNQAAINIVCSLTIKNLDSIINDSFERQKDIPISGDWTLCQHLIDVPPESLIVDIANFLDYNATTEHEFYIKTIELICHVISVKNDGNNNSDIDISRFKSHLLDSVENYLAKITDFSDYAWEDLKGNYAPNSGQEKAARAVMAIMAYNDDQWKTRNKYCITTRAVMDVTGSRHSIVKKFFDDHEEMIDEHNKKHGLRPVDNRGNKPISEVIQVP
jgi:hypothetical protein